MTIHSTQHAQYIGRVGALAVALGVGVALASGQGMGVAHADDSNSTKSSGKSPSVDGKTSAANSDTDRPAHRSKPDKKLTASGNAVVVNPSHGATEPTAPAAKDLRPQRSVRSQPTAAVAAVSALHPTAVAAARPLPELAVLG